MKLVFNYLLVFSTLLMMASCRDFKSRADLIIYNTTIYTVDSSETVAASIAIREGKILAVGTDAEVRSRYWSENNINAKGMFVYPGFIDAHSHFSGYAEYLRYADLTSAGSYEEVLSIIGNIINVIPRAGSSEGDGIRTSGRAGSSLRVAAWISFTLKHRWC
jgi:imidazolonepropionase-like amidohydrolase